MSAPTVSQHVPTVAHRVTFHEARRYFEAGGRVLVSEHGHEPTQPVTRSTTTHHPYQRFYIVPTVTTAAGVDLDRWADDGGPVLEAAS